MGRNKAATSGTRGQQKAQGSPKFRANGLPGEWAACLVLAAVTLGLYGQVLGHEFIDMDDKEYISSNPHIQAGLSWRTVKWAFVSTQQNNWHPVTWLSHALDCHLFGLWAGGHHFVSLLIHLLNACLLFLLLYRATAARERSFLVAALFAWHPFNVESVAWAAERKNVLSTLFFLLTLGAYGWYAQRPGWRRYIVVLLLFALGLAAKPMLVTLPFVLLLLDFWPLQRIRGWLPQPSSFPVPQVSFFRSVLEKLPLLTLSVLSSIMTFVAQGKAVGHRWSFMARLANAFYSYLMYICKTLWPTDFAVYYPHPFPPSQVGHYSIAAEVLVGVATLVFVGITVVAWRHRLTSPYLATGWFWYVGTLVPVIGIVQVGMQGMADRYAYVPLIGLFVILTWGSTDLADKIGIGEGWRVIAGVTAALTLCFLTFRQIGYWQNSHDLWTHALAVTHDNFMADDHMGMELLKSGRPDSIRYFADAANIEPRDPMAHDMLAGFFLDNGRLQEAISEYRFVTVYPLNTQRLALAHANLGIIYVELGDSVMAQSEFQQAITTRRSTVDEMIDDLRSKVSKHPSDEGYLRLGLLLEQTGRIQEARTACGEAVALKPDRVTSLACLHRLMATIQ